MDNKVYYGEYSLRHWIDLILSKNITLPEYQRYFVWGEKKVETLIQAFKEKHFVPPVTIGLFQENDKSLNLILDGQQRLTSILLAYLGIYPDKDAIKKSVNESQTYNDTMENRDDSDDGLDSDNILDWNFSKLQNKGATKDEIIRNQEKYYKTISYSIDDVFLDNNYLGFCFLVPANDDTKFQQKYYSSVFRAINIQGETLLPQESRASLYYLNKDLKPFFDPDFMKRYKININNNKVGVDFVRYLSLIAQYFYTNNIKEVAKGTKMQMEKYYEEYIYSVVSDSNTSKFGIFSEIFKEDGFVSRLEKFKKQIHTIQKNRYEFNSIISLDLVFFGLIYYVVFQNKLIDLNKVEELNKKIEQKNQEFRDDDNHARSPNSLRYLRNRISTSIEIYGQYLNESA